MFKSSEEREAERVEREAEAARAEAARAEADAAAAQAREQAAFASTPVGAATMAKQAGQEFFEVQLEVGSDSGSASLGAAAGRRTSMSSAQTLGEIEQVGWRLEHVGYVFMVTGENSTARVFMSGEVTSVSGVTVGAYLFRTRR